jgi:hypothetical protein
MGSENPSEGITSRGSITIFIQRMDTGKIRAFWSICFTVTVVCETYSMQALQKRAMKKLIQGAIRQPKRANDICERDGINSDIPKLTSVRRMA